MHFIPMVTSVGFRNITIGIVHVPLSTGGTRVVPRSHGGIHSKLGHNPSTDLIDVKISADSKLLQLKLTRAAGGSRANQRVINGMSKIINVIHVGHELAREILRIENIVLHPAIPVEPAEVGEGKGFRGWRFLSQHG